MSNDNNNDNDNNIICPVPCIVFRFNWRQQRVGAKENTVKK